LYYTASGIITPVGGRPMHRLRKQSSLNLCTGRPPTCVMIPDAVEADNKLIIKQGFVH